MFVELLPLIKDRTSLTIFVSRLADSDKLRVCVKTKVFELPHLNLGCDKDAEATKKQIETAALAINEGAFMDGTAEELDATLPEDLAKFTAKMVEFHSNVNDVILALEEAKRFSTKRRRPRTASPRRQSQWLQIRPRRLQPSPNQRALACLTLHPQPKPALRRRQSQHRMIRCRSKCPRNLKSCQKRQYPQMTTEKKFWHRSLRALPITCRR